MGQCTIHQLLPQDYGKCANIWNMTGYPAQARRWYEELLSGNRITFIFSEDGEYLSEVSLVFSRDDPDLTVPGKRIYLSHLAVKEAHRGRGIDGMLIDFAAKYAKDRGFREISLCVDEDDAAARQLYAQKGFATVLFSGADEYGSYMKLAKAL